jgi:hypothetical protein
MMADLGFIELTAFLFGGVFVIVAGLVAWLVWSNRKFRGELKTAWSTLKKRADGVLDMAESAGERTKEELDQMEAEIEELRREANKYSDHARNLLVDKLARAQRKINRVRR